MAQLAARQIVALEVVRSKLTCVKAIFFNVMFRSTPSCIPIYVYRAILV